MNNVNPLPNPVTSVASTESVEKEETAVLENSLKALQMQILKILISIQIVDENLSRPDSKELFGVARELQNQQTILINELTKRKFG